MGRGFGCGGFGSGIWILIIIIILLFFFEDDGTTGL